jgi:Bacterial EndoU nuclease
MANYIDGIPIMWDDEKNAKLLGPLFGGAQAVAGMRQRYRSILAHAVQQSPLLEHDWSTYHLEDLTAKFFDTDKVLQNGEGFTINFGGPEPAPGVPVPEDANSMEELHRTINGVVFAFTDKNKNKTYEEGIDTDYRKLLDLKLFVSTDGAWLLETAQKLDRLADDELAIFLEVTGKDTKDKLSGNVLICKGGRNAAAYYNQPALADWYGQHSALKKEEVEALVKACADKNEFIDQLRVMVSGLAKAISWAPDQAGDFLCWIGEKLDGLRIKDSTWDTDRVTPLLKFLDKYEADIAGFFENAAENLTLFFLMGSAREVLKPILHQFGILCSAIIRVIREYIEIEATILEYMFANICGVVNGIIDMVGGFFTFIGWILKFIGGGIKGAADVQVNADYYMPLVLEYADNFMQAIKKINWGEVWKTVKQGIQKTVEAVDFDAIKGSMQISRRQLGYYMGYIGINVLGCFVGLGEIAALTRIGKLGGWLGRIMEAVVNTVGKLPPGLKLTAEGVFAVLKGYIGLLVKGTKSVIELINRIFEAVLKWILVITGKVVREVYLLTLSGGRRLACTLIPIEDIAIVLGRILSVKVKGNLAKFGVALFEREGGFYARYKGEVIFEGDKAAASKFVDDVLDKEEAEAKKILDDLLSKATERKNAFVKWKDKFDEYFFNHLDGEFGLESIKLGLREQEYIGLAQGGHNAGMLGENIRLKKGTTTIPNPPVDNLPFKAYIEVKYKSGWVLKANETSMFPKNWSKERIQEEVALVYENTVAKKHGLIPRQPHDKFDKYRGQGNSGFDLIIEVNKAGFIINSYPKF